MLGTLFAKFGAYKKERCLFFEVHIHQRICFFIGIHISIISNRTPFPKYRTNQLKPNLSKYHLVA